MMLITLILAEGMCLLGDRVLQMSHGRSSACPGDWIPSTPSASP